MKAVCTAAAFARSWNSEKDKPLELSVFRPVEATAALTVAKSGPDHTHVATSSGRIYACHYNNMVGSSELINADGVRICEGESETRTTDILAGKDGQANIKPYKTGVSHQMANRILSLSDGMPIVLKARKYMISRIFYGAFGVDDDGENFDLDTYAWPEYLMAVNSRTKK